MPTKKEPSYYEILTEAINDMTEHGFDSIERVNYWTEKLRQAAEKLAKPLPQMEEMLRDSLSAIYKKMIENGSISQFHLSPVPSRFTIEHIKPTLRSELNRRIMASAELIKLNRRQSIDKTLQRFQGWATSVPAGGSDITKKRKVKEDVKKSLASLPFEERRVLIDQGHKLTASLNEVIGRDGGAIAVKWHSHWRQPGYNYRPDHKARDGHIYLLKESWAREKGLVKPNKDGFYEDITAVAEEPFCRCAAQFIYTLSKLPSDMLTAKGRDALEAVREKMAAV